jgi:gamma-glutamyltranspeptidase/glutathione hydrolase
MTELSRYILDPGPKPSISGQSAVCSTDSAIVTETVLRTLADGGNAADGAIAGALVQAVVEPFMTNHTGTVSLLCYEARTGRLHQLHSTGTFPPHLPPFRPTPSIPGGLGAMPPAACIPGFMPGLCAIHERFGSLSWQRLCEDAVRWAEQGHPVSSFEYGNVLGELDFFTYFPEGRAFYLPNGFVTPVDGVFRSAEMAQTMRSVAEQGPGFMIEGEWAERFVSVARALGWPIELSDMSANPPRWIEPLRFDHGRHEIVSLSAPEHQGIFLCIVLGILRHLGIAQMQPGSADHLFSMAHALRLGLVFSGFNGDPVVAPYDVATLCDDSLHRSLARLIAGMRPTVDLTDHVRLTHAASTRSDGHGLAGMPASRLRQAQPMGSCELSVADADGNWVQLMNTLQSGGIPGMVIGGIPMVGSHASFAGVSGHFDQRLTPGARMRSIVGHSFVLQDSKPIFGLGTPGNVYCTVPQVITNLLDMGMSPEDAVDTPRLLPLGEDGHLVCEDRIEAETVAALARLGVGVSVMPPFDWHMGSFQMSFRDAGGRLGAVADPRRCGCVGGLP